MSDRKTRSSVQTVRERGSSFIARIRGILIALAWVGGAALSYHLLCALGFSLYLLLRRAF